MISFEDTIVQHVLDRLLVEIEKGESQTIWYTHYNTDGSSSTAQREVNVQHTLMSKLAQRLTEDSKYIESLRDRVNKMVATDEFINKVADAYAIKLIDWLQTNTGYWGKKEYANTESFNKEIRSRVVKVIAEKEADKIMASRAEQL